MRHYVSIANVDDGVLEFLGYIIVAEDEETRVISHFGDEQVVDKADPFIFVDDLNDVQLIRDAGEVIVAPGGGTSATW